MKVIRRIRTTAGWIINAVLVGAVWTAYADTQGQIVIKGTVQKHVEITVIPEQGYQNLDLENGVTDQVVATVKEKCNDKDGYTVTLESENAEGSQAYLVCSGVDDKIPYSMKYGGTVVNLVNKKATVTDATGRTPKEGVNKQLTVTISPQWVFEGEYSDTLTFTIAAK